MVSPPKGQNTRANSKGCSSSPLSAYLLGEVLAEVGFPKGAVNILYRKRLLEAQDSGARERFIAEFREQFGSPYAAAASGHVDDVILPSETRARLIAALDYLRTKQVSTVPKKHGCMPL